MRHRKAGLKLNRTSSHRKAMFRNMVTSLFKYEHIRTTDAKAKELRRWADHLITLAKRGDLHARRQALSIIREKNIVSKLFNEAAERFNSRQGGFTRIVKLGRRQGDAAPISLVELVASEKEKKKKTTKKRKGDSPKKRQALEEKALSDKKEDISSDKAPEEGSIETSSDSEEKPDKKTTSSSVADETEEPKKAKDVKKKSKSNLAKTKEKK